MPHPTGSPASDSDPDGEAILDLRLERARAAIDCLHAHRRDALNVLNSLRETIKAGGRILTCGNGGSAAEALHLAEELLGRYRGDRRALPGICLNADSTALTCIANDYGFEQIFARQVDGLIQPTDALVVFSTSGKSANILEALDAAARHGATCIGFLGGDGGPARERCKSSIVIEGDDSAAIQEAHQVLMHACCEALENL
ncbi:MAG: SIS domain-containing protein [Phycisphaerales bacterium]|nr:SIS domain-containing protein [Phycisphaerales bacterium]